MDETKYIICLTSYPERFKNLPRVLDSLWAQSCRPERVVLTLTRAEAKEYDRQFPDGLACDVLVVENDVKVYKKFLYAMEVYKTDPWESFVCVDDDYIYDRSAVWLLFFYCGSNKAGAVSGNAYWHNGLKCHCGALSLVCPAMFKGWRKYEQYFGELESSDMFYTMLAADNHFAYANAGNLLTNYATPIQGGENYTKHGQVQRTYKRFAQILGWV